MNSDQSLKEIYEKVLYEMTARNFSEELLRKFLPLLNLQVNEKIGMALMEETRLNRTKNFSKLRSILLEYGAKDLFTEAEREATEQTTVVTDQVETDQVVTDQVADQVETERSSKKSRQE